MRFLARRNLRKTINLLDPQEYKETLAQIETLARSIEADYWLFAPHYERAVQEQNLNPVAKVLVAQVRRECVFPKGERPQSPTGPVMANALMERLLDIRQVAPKRLHAAG